jgi:hypothetical protein
MLTLQDLSQSLSQQTRVDRDHDVGVWPVHGEQ